MRAAHAIAATLLVAGCRTPSVGDCAVQCTAAGGCPDGLTCEAEGYCRAAGVELSCAALLDGGDGGDGDGGGGGPDAAPCTTPGGCPFFFGRPSPVLEVHLFSGHHGSPHLSSDRLRLYFAAGNSLWVAARPSPGEPFDEPISFGIDGGEALLFDGVSLSADELVIAVAARDTEDGLAQLFVADRTGDTADFAGLTAVELSEDSENETDPTLSPDGLELWYASGGTGPFRILHRSRQTRVDAFEDAEPVTLAGADLDDLAPTPSADGLSLMFSRQPSDDTRTLMRAFRDDLGSLAFHDPEPLDDLTVAGAAVSDPFLAAGGRELFFSSTQAWSPASTAIWRVHVCGGECNDDQILCEPPAVLSPDARHCYNSYDDTANWNSHVQACNTQGGHLVTIHSDAENELVATLAEEDGVDPIWIGSTDENGECNTGVEPCWYGWVTDEPDLYEHWLADQPDDNDVGGEDCASLSVADGGFWNDLICETMSASVCERELPYPWW